MGERSTGFHWFVVKNEKLTRIQGKQSVSSSFIIRELDLEDVRGERLDNLTYLAPVEIALGQIFNECHYIQDVYCVIHLCS